MNCSKALLALCAITQTTAFVVQSPKASTTQLSSSSVDELFTRNVWDTASPILVQGDSLRTFVTHTDRVQVLLKTEGRPLSSEIELWYGPDYTPTTVKIYLEDGNLSPFNAVLETPYSNTVAVYNRGQMEFPLFASVKPEVQGGLKFVKERLYDTSPSDLIQGGALRTYQFDASTRSVQVLLKTDGRHLVARIEILQGPNNNKQVIEFYSSDGKKRSFFAVFETPEAGCVVRIVNEKSIEYPFTACVEPYTVDADYSASEPVIGGDP